MNHSIPCWAVVPAAGVGTRMQSDRPKQYLPLAGKTVIDHGVMILGPQNLPARIPFHASQMYAKNLQSFLGLLFDKDGAIVREFSDEILVASLLVHDGEVRHRPTRQLLEGGKA